MNIYQTAPQSNSFRDRVQPFNSRYPNRTIGDVAIQVTALTEQVTMLNELTGNYENIISKQRSEINSINSVIESLQQWLTILSKDISRHETMASTMSYYLTQIGAMPVKEDYKMRHPDFEYSDENNNGRGGY